MALTKRRGQVTSEPKNEIADAIDRGVDCFSDVESVFGFMGAQLERIADALEAIEKRGRPSKTYGLFDD